MDEAMEVLDREYKRFDASERDRASDVLRAATWLLAAFANGRIRCLNETDEFHGCDVMSDLERHLFSDWESDEDRAFGDEEWLRNEDVDLQMQYSRAILPEVFALLNERCAALRLAIITPASAHEPPTRPFESESASLLERLDKAKAYHDRLVDWRPVDPWTEAIKADLIAESKEDLRDLDLRAARKYGDQYATLPREFLRSVSVRAPSSYASAFADPAWRDVVAKNLLAVMPVAQVRVGYNGDDDLVTVEGNGVRYVGPRVEWVECRYRAVMADRGGAK